MGNVINTIDKMLDESVPVTPMPYTPIYMQPGPVGFYNMHATPAQAYAIPDTVPLLLYALKCEHDKFYIGTTRQPIEKRFKQHTEGNGSEWTKLYKPISYSVILENSNPFDEDRYVEEYMSKYGIDNVRGGSYSTIHLDKSIRSMIQKKIWHSNNACLRCGRTTHFISNCYAKIDVNGNYL